MLLILRQKRSMKERKMNNWKLDIKQLDKDLKPKIDEFVEKSYAFHSDFGRDEETKKRHIYYGKLNEFAQCEVLLKNNIEVEEFPTLEVYDKKTPANEKYFSSDYSARVDRRIALIDAKTFNEASNYFTYVKKPGKIGLVDLFLISKVIYNGDNLDSIEIVGFLTVKDIFRIIGILPCEETFKSGSKKFQIPLSYLRPIDNLKEYMSNYIN